MAPLLTSEEPIAESGEGGTILGVIGIHPSDPLTGLKPGLGLGKRAVAGWATTELVGLLKVLSLGPGNATGLIGKFLFIPMTLTPITSINIEFHLLSSPSGGVGQ